MKKVGWFTVALAVVCLFAWSVIRAGNLDDKIDANTWLAAAGVVVGLSALSQVIFAVVAYMESATLRNQLESFRIQATSEHSRRMLEIGSLRDLFYKSTKEAVGALLEVFMHPVDGEAQFEEVARRLQLARISADLAHGHYTSLWSAMQTAYKCDKRRFLQLEPEIYTASESLDGEWRARLRSEYKSLKTLVLEKAEL
jgi:hypothetical protein